MITARNFKLNKNNGFTLVELAIVMIIIGLLVGGVLKGQELVTNARVTGTIAQAKDLTGAAFIFKDAYRSLPGDIAAADALVRIPGCAAAPGCAATHFQAVPNNGQITNAWGHGGIYTSFDTAAAVGWGTYPEDETLAFFMQLSLTDMIVGDFDQQTGPFMVTRFKNSYLVPTYFNVAGAPPGNYYRIMYNSNPNEFIRLVNPVSLQASIAARIDTKMDDGNPAAGSVRADSAATCRTGNNYNETNTDAQACKFYILMH